MLKSHLAHLTPFYARVGLAAIATSTALLASPAIAGELNLRLSTPSHTSSHSRVQVYDASGDSLRTYGSVSSYSHESSGGSSIQLRIGNHHGRRPRLRRSPRVLIRKRVDDQFDAQGFRVYDRDDRGYSYRYRRDIQDYDVHDVRDYDDLVDHFRPRRRTSTLPVPR